LDSNEILISSDLIVLNSHDKVFSWIVVNWAIFNGINAKNGANSLSRCIGSNNDTVKDCPVYNNPGKDFIVAVQNNQITRNQDFIRIQVPNMNYSA
jgi:hypothetical protein